MHLLAWKPPEQWKKGPWLLRVYIGMKIYPVMSGLFHKPWSKDPYLNNHHDSWKASGTRVFFVVHFTNQHKDPYLKKTTRISWNVSGRSFFFWLTWVTWMIDWWKHCTLRSPQVTGTTRSTSGTNMITMVMGPLTTYPSPGKFLLSIYILNNQGFIPLIMATLRENPGLKVKLLVGPTYKYPTINSKGLFGNKAIT